jgi:hypothetical protein
MKPSEPAPPDLVRRARRAYERARALDAVARAAPLALVVILVAFASPDPAWRAAVGGAAVAAAIVSFWRGRILARAVRAGAMAALAPLAVPFAAATLHRGCACGTLPPALCLLLCVGGGAVAGAIMAVRAARESRADRLPFAAIAAVMATWLGLLGCAFAGAAGLAGMTVGLVATGAPLVALARAPR